MISIITEPWCKYYSWQCGIRIRANLSELEDWATQNGLDDEFGQMFETLLTVSELLATSKNIITKVIIVTTKRPRFIKCVTIYKQFLFVCLIQNYI